MLYVLPIYYPFGIIKHPIIFSGKSSVGKALTRDQFSCQVYMFGISFRTVIKPDLLTVPVLLIHLPCWTIKLLKGTSVFSSVLFKGRRCHWAQFLNCVFQRAHLRNFQTSLSVWGLTKEEGKIGWEGWPFWTCPPTSCTKHKQN